MTTPTTNPSDHGVSRQLAQAIVASAPEDIPSGARREAARALVNYMGCALGGTDHPARDISLEALSGLSGHGDATVLGRTEKVDIALASFPNGISAHIHDYDDTTPSNYIHSTFSVASALFAHASTTPVTGEDFLHAFILGFVAVTRIGDATYPAHHQAGWHSTGSVGVFGAAIAVAKLLNLDEERMLWTIGLAATQSAGLRDNFGSMAKSFHPGAAARSAVEAALLARAGFTTGSTPLEGPRGFVAVTAQRQADFSHVTDGLGREFRLAGNTYKPFQCGIVVHPTIDACRELHGKGIDPRQIEKVELRVARLVRDLYDIRNPAIGLQGTFSIYHAAAIGLVRGKGGLDEFTDAAVEDPDLVAMQKRVEAIADATVSEDSVHVPWSCRMVRASRISWKPHWATLNALSATLSSKRSSGTRFPILNSGHVDRVVAQCWDIADLQDVGDLARATVLASSEAAQESA